MGGLPLAIARPCAVAPSTNSLHHYVSTPAHSPDIDEAMEAVLLLSLHLLVDEPEGVDVPRQIAEDCEENVDQAKVRPGPGTGMGTVSVSQ